MFVKQSGPCRVAIATYPRIASMSVSPTIKMMAGKIGTFCFRPAIEMIGFGGHRETASGLTSPKAAGKSPRPVAQGKDGNIPLLSPSNSEEILTPIQEEARCEGRSAPIRLIPPSLFSPQSDIYGRPRHDSHSIKCFASFSDCFIQAPSF